MKLGSTKAHTNYPVQVTSVCRDSVVDIAIRYGLDGLGIEFRCGRHCPYPTRSAQGAQPASYTMGTGSILVVKRPGRGVDHPPHLAPKLKKSRTIYLLPFWAFVACSRVNFALQISNARPSPFSIVKFSEKGPVFLQALTEVR